MRSTTPSAVASETPASSYVLLKEQSLKLCADDLLLVTAPGRPRRHRRRTLRPSLRHARAARRLHRHCPLRVDGRSCGPFGRGAQPPRRRLRRTPEPRRRGSLLARAMWIRTRKDRGQAPSARERRRCQRADRITNPVLVGRAVYGVANAPIVAREAVEGACVSGGEQRCSACTDVLELVPLARTGIHWLAVVRHLGELTPGGRSGCARTEQKQDRGRNGGSACRCTDNGLLRVMRFLRFVIRRPRGSTMCMRFVRRCTAPN